MSSHTCPARGCAATVPYQKLSCARHWRMVPLPVQRAVYAAWRSRDMVAHRAAMLAAIEAMDGEVARG